METEYDQLISSAQEAFSSDVSYLISMVTQARTVINKRRVWALRAELREANQAATSQCASKEPFECHVSDPCGTGKCPFAVGDFANLQTPPKTGKLRRPMPSSRNQLYDLESSLSQLQAMRTMK